MASHHVVIVGGGAAGFFGAITCAEMNPAARVTLLEKGAHVLTKVRISGGGRCNVTHACFDPKLLIKNYPRGAQALLGPFHAFQPKDTMDWFEARGVALKTEADGRVFPSTDMSLSVINAFKDAAQRAGVEVRTRSTIVSVKSHRSHRFTIRLTGGEVMECDRLLLATGSAPEGHALAAALGHTIVPPVPSLFTFTIPDARLKGLAGVVVENVQVEILDTPIEESGAVLITHWGLSGPVILKLSAWGARVFHEKNYHVPIQINWSGVSHAEAARQLMDFKGVHAKKSVATHPLFRLPRRLWERLSEAAGLDPHHRWGEVSKIQMTRLTGVLTADGYTIRGKSTFKEEFVTCGGVCLDEVNFKTMESRRKPGLYFAGEILDVDGLTGGFNFQSAWTTAWLAGRAMGKAKA
jgi:predicted Rossmann fold flavoprotein